MAIIIGSGYVDLEMTEALTARGRKATQLQHGPEVLSTLDPKPAAVPNSNRSQRGNVNPWLLVAQRPRVNAAVGR